MAAEAPAGGTGAKKPRPPPPAPPPAVGTAALLIRGAAARVLGLRPGLCGGDLQPVWVTEPGCAKISISLEGSSRTPFPKEEQHRRLVDAVEEEVARLVAADAPIASFVLDAADAAARYGEACGSSSSSTEGVRLAYVPGAALVQLPSNWSLCPTAGACGAVQFLVKEEEGKKKPDTTIVVKRKQLTVKYVVANADAPGRGDAGEAPSAEAAKELDSGAVRVPVQGVDFDLAKADAPADSGGADASPADEAGGDMVVDPWKVKGKIDYNKLVEQFGSTRINEALLTRMTQLSVGKGRVPKLHRWLRRSIFFSHRDMDQVCKCLEDSKPCYLYTGRGPSAGMHLGHLIPFMMTQWLQEAFNVPLVIQMTDDEKFLWKGEYDPTTGDNLMHFRALTTENAKDIIACGFDKKKTFIFSDLEYVGHMYPNIVRTWKAVTYNTARGAFGFQGDSNIGQSAFPAIQAVPSFPSSFKVPLRGNDHMACLIPCAIDQDPYFRVTRDIAHKLVPADHPLKGKPALLHAKFFPPLQGAEGKMSSSDSNSAVFLTDTPEEIERKIMECAFSGGRQTAKEQREKGADLEVDVAFQWLRFFLDDDEELARIEKEYGTGTGEYWSTGVVKQRLIRELKVIVAAHQERRAKITDEEVAEWMRVRELEF
mmetsp:Transcript_71018/g.154361  ORF Transcript_71018/g.154361 Transcript_71018/m.154361 type:complete len:653 (+) Transcript_71018:143-2101(+)